MPKLCKITQLSFKRRKLNLQVLVTTQKRAVIGGSWSCVAHKGECFRGWGFNGNRRAGFKVVDHVQERLVLSTLHKTRGCKYTVQLEMLFLLIQGKGVDYNHSSWTMHGNAVTKPRNFMILVETLSQETNVKSL